MSAKATRTDFFIVGAPRSGTTAMSSYLAEHSQVTFADPKEPLFFCSDMPGLQAARDVSDYENNYFPGSVSDASVLHMRGEGSVWYLFSETAIPNILSYNPDARFIVMLRNPIDLLSSLHQKLFLFLDENESDFEKAWALQEVRESGEKIPTTCREPRLLRYRSIGRLGLQVQRMLSLVNHSNIHLVFYDDFASNQRDAYQGVVRFLGLDDDARQTFPQVNANRKVLSRPLFEALSRPSPLIVNMVKAGKRVLGIERLGVLPVLRGKLTPEMRRQPMDSEFRKTLVNEFSDDVALLGRLAGRDLSHWFLS